jgi:hypothetical protein
MLSAEALHSFARPAPGGVAVQGAP